MNYLKQAYRKLRSEYAKTQLFYKVNWVKTLYFNFTVFPYPIAKKLPIFFYGKVKMHIGGKVIIDAPVKRGMIGFGQPYEMNSVAKGTAELKLEGTIVFRGHVQFGKDYFIYVRENAIAEFGHMASLGSNGKIVCTESIIFGDYARIGAESQLMDTTFHLMYNTVTMEEFPMSGPIVLGNYNYIGNRVSVMKNTVTPDNCTVASSSLCNKDYTLLGSNILIGGMPAKLLQNNISRHWEAEKAQMEKWLSI